MATCSVISICKYTNISEYLRLVKSIKYYHQLHTDITSKLFYTFVEPDYFEFLTLLLNNCQCRKAYIHLYWNPKNAVHNVELLGPLKSYWLPSR